jgi:DNA-binding IclR family transcriptional regulator
LPNAPTSEDSAGKPARYRVAAVEKALELLSAFSHERPHQSLADLAETTGLPRPTAFRILNALEAGGFVRREGTDYALGFKCFMLGNVASIDITIANEAQPYLESLRDVTGETTQLAVLEDWQVVYLSRVRSHQAVAYMRSRVGAVLPAYCTGLGKALLAAAHRPAVEAWMRTQQFPRVTPNTITSHEEMVAELDRTAERGYSIDDEEREPGVRCIASVIRDATGEGIAAVSVAGPPTRMPEDLVGSDMAKHVVACASAISERMGYVEPSE